VSLPQTLALLREEYDRKIHCADGHIFHTCGERHAKNLCRAAGCPLFSTIEIIEAELAVSVGIRRCDGESYRLPVPAEVKPGDLSGDLNLPSCG
jgi:hypothetical protein